MEVVGSEIKFKGINFDFSEHHHINAYKEKVADQVKDLDLAMVFLNAADNQAGPFTDIHPEHVHGMVQTQVVQTIYTAKVLVDQLVKRNKRCAIVATAQNPNQPIAGMSTTTACKSAVVFLMESLAFELKDKNVDCMAWYCGMVATKSTRFPEKGRYGVVVPDVAVAGMLKDLGKEISTTGCWTHVHSSGMLTLLPANTVNKIFYKGFTKVHEKNIKEGFAKAKTD